MRYAVAALLSLFIGASLYAASCDTTNYTSFKSYGSKTYAVSKANMTPTAFATLPSGAKLASPNTADIQGFLQSNGYKGWIAIYDPNYTQTLCMNLPCPTDSNRFANMYSGAAPSYTNWNASGPTNFMSSADFQTGMTPLGQHWAYIGDDGTWQSANIQQSKTSIVEWSEILDCVKPASDPNSLDGLSGTYCADPAAGTFAQCKDNTCDYNKTSCPTTSGATDPTCPSGGTLNTTRDTCQLNPNITCPTGEVYDSVNKICEKAFTKGCSTNYSYITARDRCEANPICSESTYNPATNKCESGSYSCPNGGTLQANNTCEYTATLATVGGTMYSNQTSSTHMDWNTAHMDWNTANNYCANLVEGGFDDWRLPTLAETTAGGGCVPSVGNNLYFTWTSTAYYDISYDGKSRHYYWYGSLAAYFFDSVGLFVRCVR